MARGTIAAAVAFFDGVFVGLPVAILAASLRPGLVYVAAAIAVSALAIACSSWVDARWDEFLSGNGTRLEKRLTALRKSRLMRHPVAWVQRSSDRWYALAAAVVNPVLVVGLARTVGGKPVGHRRIVLGAVAYALPYVALWTLVGLALRDAM